MQNLNLKNKKTLKYKGGNFSRGREIMEWECEKYFGG
jgi:hypothetical protein